MKLIIELRDGKVDTVYSDVEKIIAPVWAAGLLMKACKSALEDNSATLSPGVVHELSEALAMASAAPAKIEIGVMNWDWKDKDTEDTCIILRDQAKDMFVIF